MAACSDVDAPRTMRFQGYVRRKPALILVDSGSSSTFVSSTFASELAGIVPLSQSVAVKVADGSRMCCTSQVLDVDWSVQGCNFRSDMKVVPPLHYDIIVGMDWLEAYSPMKVHWKNKWMSVPYAGSSIILQGLGSVLPEGTVVEVCAVLVTDSAVKQVDLPPELSALLDEFAEVFAPPSWLPPERDCDHTIPLVASATSVSVRPYRHPPAIKNEIERQVKAMLQEGIIQHSVSPFSSSGLLVRKKDMT